jgi:hypothetical protein
MLLLGIVTVKQERPLHAERGAMGGEWGGCQQEKPSTVACLFDNKFNQKEMNACMSVFT